ncbi:polymorphic toxin-type HINT domain-containing protein [Saccharibacillus sp. O23]|uniref:polymorphic toxin-type HINT domain-containing protein n=1 Tax=Saccharibacillus sp. O23 TaxID=2009338 RepID=UPI00211AC970|nr:polymorphic toxin-type HINT domain-containing protein [Saccharibacillus sp. O23]
MKKPLFKILNATLAAALLLPPVSAPNRVSAAPSVSAPTAAGSVSTLAVNGPFNDTASPMSLYEIAANTPYSGATEGENVSDASGTLTRMETDLTLPGRNGLDFTLGRLYQSNTAYIWEPKITQTTNASGQTVYTNDNEYYTYNERTSNLGVGWSWAFPSVEQRGSQRYLHMADGTVYPIAANGQGLVDYPLKDVTFGPSTGTLSTKDASGATVSATIAYALTDTLGTKAFFNTDGRWIGTKDAYGNVILVQYAQTAVNEQNAYPMISRVIDTLNREIKFTYSAGDVKVNYDTGKTLTYGKSLITDTQKKRNLAGVTNENGETVSYRYDKKNAAFDADGPGGAAAGATTYSALTGVVYPTGASTGYDYGKTTKHFGDAGTADYYRVTQRSDSLKKDGNSVQSESVVTYDYTNATDFSDPAQTTSTVKRTLVNNPNDASNVPRVDKITESTTLNADHLAVKEVREKAGEYKKQIDTVYDPDQQLAVQVTETDSDYTQNPAQTGAKVSAYTYDDYGNVLTYTNPLGHISAYTYSPTYPGLLTSERNTVSGVVTDDVTYTPDASLPHIKQTVQNYTDDSGQASFLQMTYQHDAYGNMTQAVQQLEDGKTQQTDIAYAAAYKNAYPTSIKQKVTVNGTPKTIEERYEYDLPTGRVTKHFDGNAVAKGAPAGSDEAYEYDSVGRITKVTRSAEADGTRASATSAFTYSTISQNGIYSTVDEEGKESKQFYDGLGRPSSTQLKRKDNNNNVDFYTAQSNHYNALGEMDYTVDGEGHKTTYVYDANGDVKQTISAAGRVTGYAYNDMLNQATTTTDYGEKVTSQTDAIGRETGSKREDGAGNSITSTNAYEVGGNPFATSATDGKGLTTGFTNDGLHRLQNVTQSASGTSLSTKYSYNKLGAMTEKLYPDLTKITYGYDELGRRLSKTDSVLGKETYTYDDNSNITGGKTREGINVLNQYDAQNRLTSWSSGDKNGSFTYYKNGLRKTMVDETGTTQYFYTLDNQLERMIYPDGKQISYTYYKNGLPSSMTDPFGLTTTYLYNDDNQLVQVRTSSTTQAEYVYRDGVAQSDANYLKSSQLYQTKQANGQITTTYTNDGFGRLTNLLQSAVGLTRSYTYGYDNNDNIISRGDGTTNSTFTYDELDRIITSSEGSETYTYDGKGNRLTLQSSIQMPHKDNVDYTYNQAEQLGKVVRNQTSVSYKYNGDGLMTERSVTKNGQATTTRYYYDGMNIIAEGSVAANGTVTFKARYVRGAQLIYREDANNQKAYYLHNGHGDVTALLKADGTVLNRYTYDIWGNPLTSDVQVENPFGYSGEFWDGDTGLQYLRSRWYDPSIGRFIQEDTFEGYVNRPSSLNPYTYVENNPLKYLDPYGYAPQWLQNTWSAVKKGTKAAADFLVIDDIKTLTSSQSSTIDKVIAGASLIPAGKIIKGGKLVVKLAKAGDKASDASKATKAVAKACNCFTAGTKVKTDQGDKNIEDVQVGDRVLSQDDNTGEEAYKTVTATFNHETDEIYRIHVGGQVIESTYNHPFWVVGKGWVFVKDLKPGDLLEQSDGKTLEVGSIEIQQRQATVYNMTVDGFHTYFVSSLGVWVHNVECAFTHGQLFETSVMSKTGLNIKGMAEVHIEGSTITLKDLAIYPDGVIDNSAKNNIGPREIIAWKNQVSNLAKNQGFSRLRITGSRAENSSSANPGKGIDLNIDLTK